MPNLRLACLGVHLLVTALSGALLFRTIGPVWALLLTLPLLGLVPGIRALKLKVLRLTTILLVPYLTVAVMEMVANAPLRGLAAGVTFGSLTELVVLIALIRVVQSRTALQYTPDEGNA